MLRYFILFAIYLLFAKDWKSVSQMLMMNQLYGFDAALIIYVRGIFVALNEFVIFKIVICTNIGEDRGIGLIVNFAAALIICELDDIIMATGRVQYYREYFDN